jgi:hypothetical protein
MLLVRASDYITETMLVTMGVILNMRSFTTDSVISYIRRGFRSKSDKCSTMAANDRTQVGPWRLIS